MDASIETSPFDFHVIVGIKNGYASANFRFETKGMNVTSKTVSTLRDWIYFIASSKLASLFNHPMTALCGSSIVDAYTIQQFCWGSWRLKSDFIKSVASCLIVIASL